MIDFKNEKDMLGFAKLHPILLLIFSDLYVYALEQHGVHLTVTQTTSTLKQDKALGRVSAAHRHHIAIDIRTFDLEKEVRENLVGYINSKEDYKQYKYLSRSGAKRLAYYHNSGHGAHLHLAIHSKFAIKK